MTLAVIVAAHGAAPWLEACLDSIDASAATCQADVHVEVRVGVDACQATAAALARLGRAYYWSAENVGPYVMRNSLVALASADAYVMFDADDVMVPAFLPRMHRALRCKPIAGPSRIECHADLQPLEAGRVWAYKHGICGLRHEAWEALGGYRAERVGADVDLIARADLPMRRPDGRRVARVERYVITEALYYRRRHAESLTRHAETGFGSSLRREARKRMEQQRRAYRGWRNEPVTVPLVHVLPTEVNDPTTVTGVGP